MWKIYAFYCNIEDIYGVWATGLLLLNLVDIRSEVWWRWWGGRGAGIVIFWSLVAAWVSRAASQGGGQG